MTQKQTHIAYGFITALALVILYVIFQVSGLSEQKWVQYVGWAIMLVGLVLNGMAFSKANNADVRFGQVFSSCFKATAIITIVVVIWTVAMFWIFPGMETQMLEKARQAMAEKQNMSEEQIEKGMALTRKFFKVFMAAGSLFGTLIVGLIFSLIAAVVAKKNPQQQPGTIR